MAAAKASAHVLDFTNTKDGGASFNKKRVPMGDYLAKVTKVEDSPTKENKEPQWLYSIELVDKYTDRCFPYYCKLVENQLWKVRNLFIAAGLAIPKKKVKLDPNRVVGKMIAVTLEDDEYDGKLQSTIVQVFPANELDGDDVDADEDDVDEEEEEDEDLPETADDEDDEEEDEEEADEEDEEEEEPEPAPARKRAAAKIPAQRKSSPATKAAAPARRAKAKPVEDDELEELDLEEI